MGHNKKSKDQVIAELSDRIESLEIQIRHQSNDLRLTKEEYENSVAKYFEIYSNMENIIDERTRKLQESQEILEQKGRELQAILDSAPVMIYYKDMNGKFLRVNKRFAEVIGYPIDEIIGKQYSDLFPDADDYGQEKDREVARTGESLLQKTESVETLNGTRQIKVDRIPYRNGEKGVVGVIGFANDITEIKQMEAEKEELENQLAQAQKMESIGELAGGIAHDFNNILGVILGYTQLVYYKMEDGDPLKNHLNEVIKSTEQATGIVQTLLDYARPQQFEFKPANLYDHAAFVLKQLRKQPDYDESRVQIRLSGEETVISDVDVGKMEQALFNLGKNAIQAIPEDQEGTVEFRIREVELDEAAVRAKLGLQPGAYIEISVIDNGIGIPPAHQQRIFEPFFTTKQIGEGTGLGLSQVYSVVKGHSGYLEVESQEEEGTTFTLYLKASENAVEEEPDKKAVGDYQANDGEQILVVEDTDRMRELVRTVLEDYGYRVETACDGIEGLARFEECKPHLTIVDLRMPNMDGKDTLSRLREKDPESVVILSSGHAVSDDEVESLGVDAFIPKPYEPTALAKTVRNTLDRAGNGYECPEEKPVASVSE